MAAAGEAARCLQLPSLAYARCDLRWLLLLPMQTLWLMPNCFLAFSCLAFPGLACLVSLVMLRQSFALAPAVLSRATRGAAEHRGGARQDICKRGMRSQIKSSM